MNRFKKALALVLVMLSIFSCFAFSASAVDEIQSIILGDIEIEEDEDERLLYGVHYEVDSFAGVKVMYKPNPNIEFNTPSRVTITEDVPLSVDYECIGWEDRETGKMYTRGETIEVYGKVTLYAVWVEKDDNDPRVIRTIKTGFQTFLRMLQKAFGVFKAINTPIDPPVTSATTTTESTLIHLTDPAETEIYNTTSSAPAANTP